ncbi:tape measure protein [Ligilactobacillus cholophilus]|uniref:tape measure protein n=1 Tax=Ligilactobacillus cholophilus TaxID=3050131 RepID=UPI0025AF0756|nr:tape measure protein [Ligilactobacillus cholophilus]
MASNKVAGTLSTKIKMDTTEAQKSIKELNNDISSTVSILKQQEQELKNSGDATGALETKITRLKETQNGYYEKLKLLKQAQNDVKDRLGESSTEYQKYQTQINNTITVISRYDNQINKAEKSLEYYDSGLAKLRQSYSEQQRVSQSLVEKLKAEGNTYQAQQEELKQSKNALSNLQEQYQVQEKELTNIKSKLSSVSSEYSQARTKLNELAQSQGKSSSAYKEQQGVLQKLKNSMDNVNSELNTQTIRLNKTATEMANTKSKANSLHEELSKKHPNFLSKVREHLTTADDKTNKLSLSTTKLFAANMLSNGLTSALSALGTKLSDLISQGNEYLDYEQKMNATWLTLTGNATEGDKMVKTINDMATASQNSTQMVDGLAKQFYAVTQNRDKTMELSKSVLTLQDAFGATDDAVQNFAVQYSQMVANGKASAQDFLSFTNVFPQLKQQLLEYEKSINHNAKMTTKDLNEMISDGKVSAEDMNKVLIDMADKYKDATDNFTNTIPGLKRTIDATMPKLVAAIEQPFYNMKNPILGSLSKAITDPAITQEVGKLGKTLSNALNDVMTAFGGDGKKFDGVKVLKDILEKLQGAVKTFASTVVTHKKNIKDFLSVISTASVASWKVFAETLQILLPVIKNVANAAAEHPKIFAALTTAIVASTTAVKLFRTPLSLIVGTFGTVSSAIKKTKDHTDTFKTAFSKVKGIISPVTNVLKNIASVLGNKLVQGLTKAVSFAGKFLGIFKTIGAFMLTNPLGLLITALSAVVVGLVELYKHSATFRKFCHELAEKFGELGKSISKMAGKIVNWIKDMVKGIQEKFDSFKKACGKVGEKFGEFRDDLKKKANNIKEKVSEKWNDLKDATKDKFNNIKDTAKDKFSTMKDKLTEASNNIKDKVKDKFEDMKERVKDNVKNLKESNVTVFGLMYSELKNKTSKGLGKIKEKWSDMWSSLKEGAQKSTKSVGNAVVNIVNNVIKAINSMIKKVQEGINWVLEKFGADKVHFGTIAEVKKFASGGTVGNGGTMALVNDAHGSNYREMFATPDGKLGMFPKERNFMTWLPEGTQILNGEKSKALADMMGVPQFKNGTKDQNIFEKMFDKAWDLAKNVANIIAHPIKFLENTFSKYINISGKGFVGDIIKSAPSYFAKQGSKWVKKLAEDWKKKRESSSSNGSGAVELKNGAELTEIIKKALESNGLPTTDAYINAWLRQVATESSGNAKAVQGNIGDVNNASGDLAKGLLQVIGATFNAYKFAGHDDIFNAYDNALAAINYAKHRYGAEGMLQVIGHGHGYANGGFISQEQLAMVGEGNKPEVVIPLSSEKQGRALSLLTQTVNKLNRNAGNNTVITTDNGSMEAKLDTMIGLLSQLITTNSNGFAKQNNGINTQGLYQQMYKDQTINNYQAF